MEDIRTKAKISNNSHVDNATTTFEYVDIVWTRLKDTEREREKEEGEGERERGKGRERC
jgi:hypothetical protein